MTEEIDVGLIFNSPHGRPIDKVNVARLADSIQQVGLLHAVCVRKVVRHRGTTPFDAYEIIGGHHRYAAALALKWRTVRCEVVTLEGLQAEMAEIDENLIRADLTSAQAASAVARRKAIYLVLHPDTDVGKSQAGGMHRSLGHNVSDKMSLTFTAATAEATGKNRRTIERTVARGEALADELAGLVGTSLDKDRELDALAKMLPDERKEIIKRAKAGENVSARETKPIKPRLAQSTEAAEIKEFTEWLLSRLDDQEIDRLIGGLNRFKTSDIVRGLFRDAA